ncbi:hypothetical protein FRB99_005480 [Tulasnella sp. 403]|nr:hypothetical protein FRB99_005480 [Tulasnella sp. 403]
MPLVKSTACSTPSTTGAGDGLQEDGIAGDEGDGRRRCKFNIPIRLSTVQYITAEATSPAIELLVCGGHGYFFLWNPAGRLIRHRRRAAEIPRPVLREWQQLAIGGNQAHSSRDDS